jgi:hypothetical protein
MIKCNVENKFLTDQEWERVEQQCHKVGHLAETDRLKAVIAQDEETMEQSEITFQQIGDFFDKIKGHFWKKVNTNQEIDRSKEICGIIGNYQLGGKGWCCWGSHMVSIFQDQLMVFRVEWGGAEKCPFQSLEDQNYHGYEYGSVDWIFIDPKTKESLHVGDLLFHQIVTHHFSQSLTSKYHVDCAQLIKFFHLRPKISYNTQRVHSFIWSTDGIGSHLLETLDQIKDKICEKSGDNLIYYDQHQAIVIIRNTDPLFLPKHVNHYEFDMMPSNINIYAYRLKNFNEISIDEENQTWM